MANALQKHKAADAIKWVVIFLIAIGLIGAVVTLFVMLDRQTTVTEIGAEAYMIGVLGRKRRGNGRRHFYCDA